MHPGANHLPPTLAAVVGAHTTLLGRKRGLCGQVPGVEGEGEQIDGWLVGPTCE